MELDIFRITALLLMLPSAFCVLVILVHLVRPKLDRADDLEAEFEMLGIAPKDD